MRALLAFQAPFPAELDPAGARRAVPPELVDRTLRDLDAVLRGPEAGERSTELDLVPALAKRLGEHRSAAQAL